MENKGKKVVKVPEAGQWPDKVALPALITGAVLTTAGFLMAFLYAAPVNGAALNAPVLVGDVMVTHQQLLSQKIFYFHMPVAIVSFVLLAFGAYYGVRFLTTREARFDTCSRVAMELTLLFVVFTMITGDLWTRFEWGVWWTWDPRLTTFLVLCLMLIGYFVLRAAFDGNEKRETYASVFALVMCIDAPICMFITRMIPSSLHPVVFRTDGGLTPEMLAGMLMALFGMLAIAYGLYRLRVRQQDMAVRIEALKEQLEDLE